MLFGDSITERQGGSQGTNGEATAMVQTRNVVWTRVVALHLLKCELQGLDQYVGDGGDEVRLLGQCLANGRYSIDINGKNKV